MILITGGRYQGKLDYAKWRFGLSEGDICVGGVDFSKKCLAYVDRYALECVERGVEPLDVFRENPAAWRDAVVITTDISGGVVPMDAAQRAWREACGRMNQNLASQADEVWRLYCGIPRRLK